MTSSSLSYSGKAQASASAVQPVHLMVLISLSVGALVWGWLLISGQGTTLETRFLMLVGLFGLASACFIFTRVKGDHLRFFDLPIFLTIVIFVRFGVIPAGSLLDPTPLNPSRQVSPVVLFQGLQLVMLGMVTFWFGCSLIHSKKDSRTAGNSASQGKNSFVLVAGLVLYAIGFVTKSYLLSKHLYSFTGSSQDIRQNLASVQVLGYVAELSTYGLIILCIEKYRHPHDRVRSRLFWILFVSECGWGLISGMKGQMLGNFIIVAIVSSLVQRRFRKGWIVAALAGLVLIYPFMNSYRYLIRGRGSQVSSFASAANVGSEALSRTEQRQPGFAGFVESGWNMTAARLDLLWSVGEILSLGPREALLRGKERWWMIPYYPFIPRFIWRSKPILNIGGRFDRALGGDGHTSIAPTYPGGLYASYGIPGLLAGMLLLGIVAQWLTNMVRGISNKRALFVYVAIFLTAADMEISFFNYWAGLIKNLVILGFVAFAVYGTQQRPSRVLVHRENASTGKP